jgi:hypothetical protein
MFKYLVPLVLLCSCSTSSKKSDTASTNKIGDSITNVSVIVDSISEPPQPILNDTLEAMANLLGGTWKEGQLFSDMAGTHAYKKFSENFSKRWQDYDSARIKTLREFRNKVLTEKFKDSTTLFYPFSGPDILYPSIFFPYAKKYIMVGLEPVGTLPNMAKLAKDSSGNYFNQLDKALFAILKFSFFRTESMRHDLKSGELDGVLHLLFLFLNRTHNHILSAKAITLDTLGSKTYLSSFEEMSLKKMKTKGVEIIYLNEQGEQKELNYFSLDAVDYELKNNTGFRKYIQNNQTLNVYLKGASYLLHKSYFSVMRNTLLSQAEAVIQDDSGIAINYFLNDTNKWSYQLYGEYSKPVATFANKYQSKLDSMYKRDVVKKLDFGLGYNYRDKNSNFMIANKLKNRQ